MVHCDNVVNDLLLFPGDACQVFAHESAGWLDEQIGSQILGRCFVVGEGISVGVVIEEEIEGVDHRELGHEVHIYNKGIGRLGEDQSSEVVAMGILLPVQEMLSGLDLQGVAADGGPAVGRGP